MTEPTEVSAEPNTVAAGAAVGPSETPAAEVTPGAVTTPDGTVMTVTTDPNQIIATAPDGTTTHYNGNEFDRVWAEIKHLFSEAEADVVGLGQKIEAEAVKVEGAVKTAFNKLFGGASETPAEESVPTAPIDPPPAA